MEKKYCKFCGLEFEKGACTCASFLQNINTNNIRKKICDTCKKQIDADSNYCPHCGIPLNDGKNNINLQRELRGEYAEDVIEKYFGKKKTILEKIKPLFTPATLRLSIVLLSILVILFIVKIIMSFVQDKKDILTATESEIIIEETTVTTIQPIIDVKDKWVKQDGYYYCFDKNGDPVIEDWVVEIDEEGNENWYYFDIDGKLVVNSWIDGEYFVGPDGVMFKDTVTPDGARVDSDGRVIVEDRGIAVQETQVYYEDPNSTETKSASTQKSSTAGEIKGVKKDKQYELYIYDLGQHRETIKKGDDTCDIIYYRPIIKGVKEKEVNTLNEKLLTLYSVNFKNLLTNLANGRVDLPKTIVVNLIDQRSVTANRMTIICSGRIIPRKGLYEKIKFRIIYDRKSKQIRVENITE